MLKYVNLLQAVANVAGHHTETVVMKFQNQLFVVATQFMKLGTVVSHLQIIFKRNKNKST